jgi:DNA polymerase-1
MKKLGEKAEFAIRLIESGEPFAYDTETSGLDWKTVYPVGYVFTSLDRTSVYIPIRHGGGGNLAGVPSLADPSGPFELHPFEARLAKAFKYRDQTFPKGKPVIGHNLKFDAHQSLTVGIDLGRDMYCTQYGAALLDEWAKSHSLEHSCAVRGLPLKKSEAMYAHLARKLGVPNNKEAMAHFWRLGGDDPVAVDYAEGDGISTIALWEDQVPRLAEENLVAVMQLECDLIRHIVRMERTGVKVDEARLEELDGIFKKKMEDLALKLPPGFNSKAPTQVMAYFRAAGITDWPTTDLGNPSFPEKWLERSEPGRRIVAVRHVRTIRDQFIKPMREQHVFKGRVHTSFNQLRGDGFGVISGRFSSSFPNLQQVPKHNKELSELYRSLFVADDGYDFYEADFSQCEPRLFAHYAQAQVLIDGYNANPPVDMHDVTAKFLDADRDTVAKRMNMGLLTGMWPKALAGHMNWDEAHARRMWNEWFRGYPEIKDFQDTATAKMKSAGFVRTILGRRCRLDDPRFAYRATSRIIQGSNADILKYKLLRVCEMAEGMGDTLQVLMTVHDSYNWQATKDRAGLEASRALVEECSDVQGPPFLLRVPFKMDVKKGGTWAEATFGPKLKFKEMLDAA